MVHGPIGSEQGREEDMTLQLARHSSISELILENSSSGKTEMQGRAHNRNCEDRAGESFSARGLGKSFARGRRKEWGWLNPL